jgi:hypothetical protein
MTHCRNYRPAEKPESDPRAEAKRRSAIGRGRKFVRDEFSESGEREERNRWFCGE